MPSLDTQLAKRGCLDRVETSATLAELARDLSAGTGRFTRQGLGDWEVFFARVDGYGELVIAAPSHDPEAGASIWFRATPTLDRKMVANIIFALSRAPDLQFLDPDSGEEIRPDLRQLLRDSPRPSRESVVISPKPGAAAALM